MEFNKSIIENIKARYSCRSYEGKPLEKALEIKLRDFLDSINSQIKINARFIYMTNNTGDETPVKLGTYGMIAGATNFIIGICDKEEKDYVEFGYLFEEIILYATDLDLQTCWLGGTFNRNEFTQKCRLLDNEYIAIACPVGVKKQKPRIFDNAVRSLVGANNKKPASELFFDQDLSTPLDFSGIGDYKTVLEMVRIGPSASNKQPWRIIKSELGYNFYLARTKAYPMGLFDMQRNDIGIAMCHFELTAKELGLKGEWNNLNIKKGIDGLEYIKTWVDAE
jgi:nitroreductase